MKICMLTGQYLPYVSGGGENNVRFASHMLMKQGHEVFIITTEPYIRGIATLHSSVKYEENIKIYSFYPINLCHFSQVKSKNFINQAAWCAVDAINFHAFCEVKKILKIEKPDVVHVNNFRGISILSSKSIKSLNIPWLYTIHSVNLICPRGSMSKKNSDICAKERLPCKLYSMVNKSVLGSPNAVISPSIFIKNKFIENGFFKESKYYVLPNPNRLEPQSIEPKSYDPINILYVGSITKSKGVYVLLSAYKKIRKNHKNVNLYLVGSGVEGNNIEIITKELDNVHILGHLDGQDLLDLYKKANVTVVPSICLDNHPSVIIESFGCGTPVIGSNVGGIPELIKDGFNGKLFAAGNSTALASILENFISDSLTLKNLETGALKSAERHRPQEYIYKLLKIYSSII